MGKYWRSRRLVFSFVGRCHGEWGAAKNTCFPVSNGSLAQDDIGGDVPLGLVA